MFKLADCRGGSAGLYCGAEGLFLGPSPLIARVGSAYRMQAKAEIASLVTAAYGSIEKAEKLCLRLTLIRDALQQGDHCRAMILAVQAQFGPLTPDGIARLAQAASLSKYNFNPDEPRDWHGRWTDGEGGAPIARPRISDHPTPRTAENPTQIAQSAPLDLSTHAWIRMQQRGVTPDQVLDAIENGNRITQPNGNIRCTGAGCVVVINPSGRIVTIY